MRSHAIQLILATSLILVGPLRAAEPDPIATGGIPPARSSGGVDAGGALGRTNAAGAGFGFSPFLEEGLVGELPPLRNGELRPPAPAYRRDFGRLAEP